MAALIQRSRSCRACSVVKPSFIDDVEPSILTVCSRCHSTMAGTDWRHAAVELGQLTARVTSRVSVTAAL